MIEYIEGDIFDSPAQMIVNPVNTVGVMGKGLALEFKKRYPDMFEAYRTVCEKGLLNIGNLMLWRAIDHWILLFPTKENWRNPSKTEYIELGLRTFASRYSDYNITSAAFPKLGCGNGELDWNNVKPIMEKYLKPLLIDVYIYIGKKSNSTAEHKTPNMTMKWLKSYAKDLSFNGVKDDIIYHTSMLPYEFKADKKDYTVKWDDGLDFHAINDDENVKVLEQEFFEIWDEIRNRRVFHTPLDDQKRKLIYAMLFSLGYISEIRLQNNETLVMDDGYQINEGCGRTFALRGN